jgi:hypothetical protein
MGIQTALKVGLFDQFWAENERTDDWSPDHFADSHISIG